MLRFEMNGRHEVVCLTSRCPKKGCEHVEWAEDNGLAITIDDPTGKLESFGKALRTSVSTSLGVNEAPL